jgi:hypothetical protein
MKKSEKVETKRAGSNPVQPVVIQPAKFDLEKELTELIRNGICPALIYDDDGHWMLATDGVQPVGGDCDMVTFFVDDKKAWKDTIQEAVEYAIYRVV